VPSLSPPACCSSAGPPLPPGDRDVPGGFAIVFLGLGVLVGLFLAVAGLALTGDGDPLFHGH
jgi:hypothetical protein